MNNIILPANNVDMPNGYDYSQEAILECVTLEQMTDDELLDLESLLRYTERTLTQERDLLDVKRELCRREIML